MRRPLPIPSNSKLMSRQESEGTVKAITIKRIKSITSNSSLYIMLLPSFVVLFIFNYLPMYGTIMAFEDFQPLKGIFGSEFVGLKWFKYMFMNSPDFMTVFGNTLIIAIAKIIFTQLAAILFALLLNEVRNKMLKRTVQTAVYFPYFLSWVIAGGVFIDLLSTEGIINGFLNVIGLKEIFFLASNTWFRPIIVATNVWKEFGYAAIFYLAALTTINMELYEAARIDGANRIKQIMNITLPGISSTIVLMFALNLGNVMNAGQDQILVMYNPSVYQTGDIIDTFVYRSGLLDAQFPFAAAVGLFRSVITFGLMIIANKLANSFANSRIF